MHVNYEYLLERAARLTQAVPGARILDYGCGDGLVVQAGIQRSLDIYGADVFYGGSTSRENVARLDLPEGRVQEIKDGVVPFPVGHFDLVLSNPPYVASEEMATLEADVRDHEPNPRAKHDRRIHCRPGRGFAGGAFHSIL